MNKLLALAILVSTPVSFVCAQVSVIYFNHDKENATLTFDFTQLAPGHYFQAHNFGPSAAALGFGLDPVPAIVGNRVLSNSLVNHLGQSVPNNAVNGIVRQYESSSIAMPLTFDRFWQ
ncbi:MAG: hypothetical protein LR015_08560 [Verrucomicrobia bacterium]|nr:hypothetical protein [Verrucomicrobiota bacterium]